MPESITPYESWFATAEYEVVFLEVHPENSDIIYGGCKGRISRHNRETDQVRHL
jgi:hypothetical protein